MLRISRKIEYKGNCGNCGKTTPRMYELHIIAIYSVGQGEIKLVLCRGCIQDLKYKLFEHTRWP